MPGIVGQCLVFMTVDSLGIRRGTFLPFASSTSPASNSGIDQYDEAQFDGMKSRCSNAAIRSNKLNLSFTLYYKKKSDPLYLRRV
uniref:Uncharacterized protein n=1 Tax=Parascaris univalens TaxID=6257 RepID=A0A914ZMJ5_PARUN